MSEQCPQVMAVSLGDSNVFLQLSRERQRRIDIHICSIAAGFGRVIKEKLKIGHGSI